MKHFASPLLRALPVLLALTMVAGMAGSALAQDSASLSYKAVQKWKFVSPKETWTPVSGQVPIPHAGGQGFEAVADGHALVIDTSGNGKANHKVKGVGGYALLKAKDEQGKAFKYALRIKKAGGGWAYASSGFMQGKVQGVPVKLFDLDNNGVWNEVGTDGMIVGKGSAVSFLSKVWNLKGELFKVQVSADGRTTKAQPYTGDAGILNVRKEFKAVAKLSCAIVQDESGDYSFDLASAKRGMKVPVGRYVIAAGCLMKGNASVKMRPGRMKPIEVKKDETSTLAWGAKIRAEFTYARSGDKVTIAPSAVKYYGRAGVEFHSFMPETVSPKFIIKDAKTGRELASGRFAGC